MPETQLIYELIQAGSAGLVIIVVVLFLKYLAAERSNRTVEHTSLMGFIAEQRKQNNDSVNNLADAITVSMGSLSEEIHAMRESGVEHHSMTCMAIQEMRERRAGPGDRRRNENKS